MHDRIAWRWAFHGKSLSMSMAFTLVSIFPAYGVDVDGAPNEGFEKLDAQ